MCIGPSPQPAPQPEVVRVPCQPITAVMQQARDFAGLGSTIVQLAYFKGMGVCPCCIGTVDRQACGDNTELITVPPTVTVLRVKVPVDCLTDLAGQISRQAVHYGTRSMPPSIKELFITNAPMIRQDLECSEMVELKPACV